MRVLVTGAAGLYGWHAIEELAALPQVQKVLGIDDFTRGLPGQDELPTHFQSEKIQLIQQRFQETTVKELNSLNIDVVIHLAGYNSGKESINTPEEYFLNNEYGTFKLIQTLMRTKNRPFFIYASTTEVYGALDYIPIDEKHPLNPQTVHAVTKLAAEKHVLAAGKWCNYPVAAFRFANTYGENQNICGYTSVVASFIDRALRNEPLIVYGTGEQTRDFIYIKDAAMALCRAVANIELVEGKTMNIATGKQTSINDLAKKIIQLTGATSEIIMLPCEKGDPEGGPISIALVRQALEWSPRFSLEEGLMKTINWHKSIRSI